MTNWDSQCNTHFLLCNKIKALLHLILVSLLLKQKWKRIVLHKECFFFPSYRASSKTDAHRKVAGKGSVFVNAKIRNCKEKRFRRMLKHSTCFYGKGFFVFWKSACRPLLPCQLKPNFPQIFLTEKFIRL